jgi:maltose O-acetyltransferase
MKLVMAINFLKKMAPKKLLEKLVRFFLIHFYLYISDKSIIDFKKSLRHAKFFSPVLFRGLGKLEVKENVIFGIANDPGSFSCSYIDIRHKESIVSIGKDCIFNNNLALISEGPGIFIGQRNLIGQNCTIMDSNFHSLDVKRRGQADPNPLPVIIHNDIFIGANVTILKGVEIESGSIIGAGSVLPTRLKVPKNSTVFGNPAKVNKQFN